MIDEYKMKEVDKKTFLKIAEILKTQTGNCAQEKVSRLLDNNVEAYVMALRKLLYHDDPHVSFSSAILLARYSDDVQLIGPLVNFIRISENFLLKSKAQSVLGKIIKNWVADNIDCFLEGDDEDYEVDHESIIVKAFLDIVRIYPR